MTERQHWRSGRPGLVVPGRSSAALIPYAVTVALAGAVASALLVLSGIGSWRADIDPSGVVLAVGIVAVAVPRRLCRLRGGGYVVSLTSLLFAALAMHGPLTLLIAASLAEAVLIERRRDRFVLRAAFNHGAHVLEALGGRLVLTLVAGTPLTGVTTVPLDGAAVAALVLACAACLILGELLCDVAARLQFGKTFEGWLNPPAAMAALVVDLGLAPLLVLGAQVAPWVAVLGVLVAAAGSWAVAEALALRDAVMTDELTGLGTRRHLQERSRVLRGCDEVPVWLALLDLDGFKLVNDRLGHAAGDHVLTVIGERIRVAAPEPLTAVRLGGDEFALLLPGRCDAEARTLVQSLCAAVARPVEVGAECVHVGVSFGLARAPDDAVELSGLLEAADERLYAAKAGRARDAARGSLTA